MWRARRGSAKKAPAQTKKEKGAVNFMDRTGYRKTGSRKRRGRRRGKNMWFFLLLAFLLSGAMLFSALRRQEKTGGDNAPESQSGDEARVYIPDQDASAPDEMVDLSGLYSPHAILTDAESGEVLAELRAREKIYPASLTKIMTAVLAIENTEDLEEFMTLPEDYFEELYAQGASMAGFLPGESVRLRDLLYGILLPSGAECSMAFAVRIAGTEDAFVEMMNRKAKELGLSRTHFCNVTGLHDRDHYSTVEDISILLQYALKNAVFREAFTSASYQTASSWEHPDGLTLFSTMYPYRDLMEVEGGEILGGKTGYTDEAGLCLASLAGIGDGEYILVTAKAEGTHETEPFHILDAVSVYSRIGAAQQGAKETEESYEAEAIGLR